MLDSQETDLDCSQDTCFAQSKAVYICAAVRNWNLAFSSAKYFAPKHSDSIRKEKSANKRRKRNAWQQRLEISFQYLENCFLSKSEQNNDIKISWVVK